jgi:hypothetical protein
MNATNAETLASGAIVCRTKDGIKALHAAVAARDDKKLDELIASGNCSRVDGNPHIAITKACGKDTQKILLNGEPVWVLSRHIR